MFSLFQGLNSAELLRLYIEYDLLEEAVSLCIEYVDAVIDTFRGQNSELFQIKVPAFRFYQNTHHLLFYVFQ